RATAKSFTDSLELMLHFFARIRDRATILGDEAEDIRETVVRIEVEVRSLLKEVRGVYELVSRPLEPGTLEKIEKAMTEDPGVWITHDEMVAEFVNGVE